MSSTLTKFNEFVESQGASSGTDLINLSQLAELFCNATPIQLKLDSDFNAKEMATVILINLYKYSPNNAFPLVGLEAINRIIRKDVDIEDVSVLQILLLHLTKMKGDVFYSARTIANLDRLTLDVKMDDRVQQWQKIAKSTIDNKHVRSLIDRMITETFGKDVASQVFKTKDRGIEVTFVSTAVTTLRGFSGYNTVYINKDHFDEKVNKPQWSNELVLVDVVTVTVHELAHVRSRKVFNDLNSSSPILMADRSVSDPEFGRIVERKMFGAAVDWDDSTLLGKVPASHITNILNAIRRNEILPSLPEGATLYERMGQATFYGCTGADISLPLWQH